MMFELLLRKIFQNVRYVQRLPNNQNGRNNVGSIGGGGGVCGGRVCGGIGDYDSGGVGGGILG